jgi:hypothetical protein
MISNIERARRYLTLNITGVPNPDPTWPWNFDVEISGGISLRLSYNEFGTHPGWELRKCVRGRWDGGTFNLTTLEGVLDTMLASGATNVTRTDSTGPGRERDSTTA